MSHLEEEKPEISTEERLAEVLKTEKGETANHRAFVTKMLSVLKDKLDLMQEEVTDLMTVQNQEVKGKLQVLKTRQENLSNNQQTLLNAINKLLPEEGTI